MPCSQVIDGIEETPHQVQAMPCLVGRVVLLSQRPRGLYALASKGGATPVIHDIAVCVDDPNNDFNSEHGDFQSEEKREGGGAIPLVALQRSPRAADS